MAGSSLQDDEPISGINVTPLVDVVLVLLVIFMITAPFIYQSAIKVQLPQAKSGDKNEKTPLTFSITKEGKVHFGKQELTWPEVEKKAREIEADVAKDPQQSVLINADKNTAHGDVVKLMDLLRQSGLSRFGLSVESGP